MSLAIKAAETEVIQYISDIHGKTTGVIVPIELWQEIAGERETPYLLHNEHMKARLLEAKERQTNIDVEVGREERMTSLRQVLLPLIKRGQITFPRRAIERNIPEPVRVSGKAVSEMVIEDRR